MTKGDIAKSLFEKGYNCAQAVFGAFAEDLGMDFDTAVKISSPFGGGMGRLREVCGTVSGMNMVLGMKYGYSDPTVTQEKTALYKEVQFLANKFKEDNGSIICRELLGLDIKGADKPAPEQRSEKYYKKRPCSELCKYAAHILEEYVNNKGRG